jgi:hypothetical protein
LRLAGNTFLVGLQHLDFNDQATIEEIRKINPAYGNAISRDVADRGNALAERIAAADGVPTASSVAKMLLMSSLSTAETPLRGLTDGELVESLVDPFLEVSEIKAALSRLQGQAWYLFLGVDQRVFFGPANVTAEITEIAANIAEEQVDQTLIRAGADRFAAEMLPIIQGIRTSGIATNDGIAEALNARGVRTARGGRWYGQTVKNVRRRAGEAG